MTTIKQAVYAAIIGLKDDGQTDLVGSDVAAGRIAQAVEETCAHQWRAEVLVNAGRPSERWAASIGCEDRTEREDAAADAADLVAEGHPVHHVRVAAIIAVGWLAE